MRRLTFFLLAAWCTGVCAEAPRQVAGLMLRESNNPQGHPFNYTLTWLREDGTAIGLWAQTYRDEEITPKIIQPVPSSANIPSSVSWGYSVNEANVATLTIG